MFKTLITIALISVFQSISFTDDPELMKEQRKIIAELSGYRPFDNGKRLNSRSTKEERFEARQYISHLITSIDLEPMLQTYKQPNVNPLVDLLFDPFIGANVYTILNATQASDTYIVLGAHFDTQRNCPGAIDNATGVAIGFSVIKKLAQLKQRKSNVILVFFDQEEEGLVGSQAFAKKLKQEKLNINSVHTFDTMGWDRDGDRAVELELPTAYLKTLYTSKGNALNMPVYTTKVNSTDHHSFRELGFNAAGLTDELKHGDYAPYKDTSKDTFDTVNFEYVASVTALVFEVTKELVQK